MNHQSNHRPRILCFHLAREGRRPLHRYRCLRGTMAPRLLLARLDFHLVQEDRRQHLPQRRQVAYLGAPSLQRALRRPPLQVAFPLGAPQNQWTIVPRLLLLLLERLHLGPRQQQRRRQSRQMPVLRLPGRPHLALVQHHLNRLRQLPPVEVQRLDLALELRHQPPHLPIHLPLLALAFRLVQDLRLPPLLQLVVVLDLRPQPQQLEVLALRLPLQLQEGLVLAMLANQRLHLQQLQAPPLALGAVPRPPLPRLAGLALHLPSQR